jgi:hypothetical protein
LRRRRKARPIRLDPKSAKEAGSGTTENTLVALDDSKLNA